jgi:hypothetical protein
VSDELSDAVSTANALALTCNVLRCEYKHAGEALRVAGVPRVEQDADKMLDLAFVVHLFRIAHHDRYDELRSA